jgi:hypothetical protein
MAKKDEIYSIFDFSGNSQNWQNSAKNDEK